MYGKLFRKNRYENKTYQHRTQDYAWWNEAMMSGIKERDVKRAEDFLQVIKVINEPITIFVLMSLEKIVREARKNLNKKRRKNNDKTI